jgi:hypothetical protein
MVRKLGKAEDQHHNTHTDTLHVALSKFILPHAPRVMFILPIIFQSNMTHRGNDPPSDMMCLRLGHTIAPDRDSGHGDRKGNETCHHPYIPISVARA